MLKKTLTTALLVCTVPAVASASWFLSTQARSAGGTIDSRNLTGQTVTDGSIFRSYTTQAAIPVTVTANAGYTIKSVTIGGVTTNAPASPFNTTIPGSGSDKSVSALFAVTGLTVTATNPGGSVTPAALGNVYYGYTLSSDVVFTFVPRTGYTITDVTGVPAGATKSVPGGVGQRATVTFPHGYVFNDSVALTAAVANTTPAINHIMPKTVVAGELVSITASSVNLTSPTYTWQYVSGPANVVAPTYDGNGKLTSTTSITPGPALALNTSVNGTVSFTPTTAGQYKFKVTAGGLSQLATVNVVATVASVSNQCQFCHTANNIGDPTISARWAASRHSQDGAKVTCAKCHIGSDTGGHPGPQVASTTCQECHTTTINDHTAANLGSKVCLDCHDGHNPAVGTRPYEVAAGTHPPVTLYTFEEIGMQMNGGAKVPVQVDASGKGMPYSPKQTCGTSGCHVINGVDYSYDKISDHAFHSNQGRSEYTDTANGKFDATKNKPWTQSTAMVGKW